MIPDPVLVPHRAASRQSRPRVRAGVLRCNHMLELRRGRVKRRVGSRRKGVVLRCQAVSEIIEIRVITAMYRPPIPEDERLQLDEMVNAALRNGCVVEYLL